MDYITLSECAYYRNERTDIIDFDTYITTDSMLPNRGGIKRAETLPEAKTIPRYLPGDILLSNIRPYFRKIWFSNREGGCSNDVLVVAAKNNIYPKFLYYVLSDDNFFNYDNVTSKGTKMPRGTPNAIMKYLVPNFDLNKQKKIAAMLSVYDDIIEINVRRISVLEQMIVNLYKEWFVRFRFPGYDKVEYENGIPKDWVVAKIGDVGNVVGGGTPSTAISEYWNGSIPWLSPSDLVSFSDVFISSGKMFLSDEGLKHSSAQLLPKDTVLLSSRAPVGYVAIAKNALCTNQGFKSVICNQNIITPYYLYYFFKENKDLLESYASGATFLELSATRLKKIKIAIPTLDLQKRFADLVESMLFSAETIIIQNKNLKKQRDLLLPRLLSGKLEVR